jgi:hypothetical protein
MDANVRRLLDRLKADPRPEAQRARLWLLTRIANEQEGRPCDALSELREVATALGAQVVVRRREVGIPLTEALQTVPGLADRLLDVDEPMLAEIAAVEVRRRNPFRVKHARAAEAQQRRRSIKLVH